MTQKNRGLLITFEGGEGAGKSTLIERLYAHLTQTAFPVIKTREPGGTPFGEEMRELLLHSEAFSLGKKSELFLFLADRADHVEKVVLPALEKKQVVLCDRFTDSTLAYQGGARMGNPDLLRSFCQFAAHDLKPDLTFFLDLDPKTGLQRSKNQSYDRIEKKALSFHHKVREAFLEMVQNEPDRFILLDAMQSIEAVFEKAKQSLLSKLEKSSCFS